MSYKTVEVELENGRVHPCHDEELPPKANALLTILEPVQPKPQPLPRKSPLHPGAMIVSPDFNEPLEEFWLNGE